MITDKTHNLFLFINFLHANIDKFSEYNPVIMQVYQASDKAYDLKTHYTEEREKRALDKMIDEKRQEILEMVVKPVKEKVIELGVFEWDIPVTLTEKYLSAVLALSRECNDNELALILKTKTQYIEFTNKVSTDIFQLHTPLFKYLNQLMLIIAKDFMEEGDNSINTDGVVNIADYYHFEEDDDYDDDDNEAVLALITKKIEDAIFSNEYKTAEIKNVYARIELIADTDIVAFDFDKDGIATFNKSVTHCRHEMLQSKLIEDINVLYLEGKVDILNQMRNLLLFKLNALMSLYDSVILYGKDEHILGVKTQYIVNVVHPINKLIPKTDIIKTKPNATLIANTTTVAVAKQKKQLYIDKEKIDVDGLKKYFTLTFLGKNTYKVNYLTESLVHDICDLENGKQVGQLALLIYESKQINSLKPKTFTAWHTIFCECIGKEKVDYKKGRLKNPTNNFRKLFYYLVPQKTEK